MVTSVMWAEVSLGNFRDRVRMWLGPADPFVSPPEFMLTVLSVARYGDRERLERFEQDALSAPVDDCPSPRNKLIYPRASELLRVATLVGLESGRLQSVLALVRDRRFGDRPPDSQRERLQRLNGLTKAIDATLDLENWHQYLQSLVAVGFRHSKVVASSNETSCSFTRSI